jgi:hypothetical protein
MSPNITPRPEQIAEFTRGRKIPFDPLPESNLKTIAEVLASVWNELLKNHKKTILSGEETEVNALLESRLNALLDEDTAWSLLVSSVARKDTMSYDGSHLEKRPDLSVHLTERNPSFPLAVECKILDEPSGKRIEMYCNDGLARFVRGEYAWASREAFMLAYVRDGSTILSSLSPLLAQSQALKPDIFQTEVLPDSIKHTSMHLARSSHNRTFRYVSQTSQNNPGVIAIWHLWLSGSWIPTNTEAC